MPDEMPSLETQHVPEMHQIAFEAFGVPIGFSTNDPAVLARFEDFMPPGSRPCDPTRPVQRFKLVAQDEGAPFRLQMNEEYGVDQTDLELALGLLDTHMCGYIAVHAPERVFVHAGAVAHEGRLILVPGMSFAGKSSLVAAFIRAGATYYSDDFAVLDERGRVHPYPKPLSLRGERLLQTTHTPESLGGTVGEEPLKPSAIFMTTYRPDAEWRPRRLSPGDAVLAVLGHTVPARERPADSLRAVTRALDETLVVESERGEADDVVPLMLAELDR